MKNIFSKLVLVALLLTATVGSAYADICRTCKKSTAVKTQAMAKAAVCKKAQSTAELNVNNVRALINGYGNMWYDGSIARYHIPKDGTSTPLYCAALWIGGTDVNNQLRIAALRFGQDGEDYWPGPLTIDGAASVDLEVCNYYDKHFKISQAEVSAFREMFDYDQVTGKATKNDKFDDNAIAQVIKEWPASGQFSNQSPYLAPFFDANGDGEYNYADGDYPYYDFNNSLCPRTLKAALNPGEKYEPAGTMETYTTNPHKPNQTIVTGGLLSDQVLKGDQTIWWVFNDMGNVHTESKGQAIGMEIRAQAFAFSTNDEINNMTFYSYEIINRSTYELRNTYFSQWVDPDLGYGYDDFIGCDVKRGLGYCYNGKATDGPGTGMYSGIPPAVGIDFFQGPYMDADGKDNPKIDINKMRLYYPEQLKEYQLSDGTYDTIRLTDDADLYYTPSCAWYFKADDSIGNCAINGVNFGNGIVDDERFGMRRFVYYENSSNSINGEPSKATDYYNYLRGFWKNGAHMKYGGNAISTGTTDLNCDFMFPGDSDPLHWGTNGVVPEQNPNDWTEYTAGDNVSPGDRRFMQSAGPFTLKPGAVNYITVGIPFAQATSGDNWTSVEILRQIDDVCQALFENCFKVLDGPDAPTLIAQELNNEVILYLTYENPGSNNYGESYSEEDPSIVKSYDIESRKYKFEGYQIYQLRDASASIADIGDETKARLVAQCDIENYYDDEKTVPIGTLVNFESNSATGLLTGKVMVKGSNQGIQHVFRITNDQFATGRTSTLVNDKEYYYIAVAYAHNRFKEYSQTDASKLDGQKEPYLAGRKNERGGTIEPITVIPHNPASENGGTVVQATYGLCPNITRIEGYGNGGSVLKLTKESIEELMGAPGEYGKQPGELVNNAMKNPCLIANPVYEQNYGPINVKVIDPLNIKPGKFNISFTGVDSSSRWVITSVDDPSFSDTADFVIGRYNEQLFLDLGIAVAISNPQAIASELEYTNDEGVLGVNYGIINDGSFLSATMEFGDNSKQWLSGIPDNDSYMAYNWVRSGQQFADGSIVTYKNGNGPIRDNEPYVDEDYYKLTLNMRTYSYSNTAVDKYQTFESVLGGLWAPYGLVSSLPYHPAFSYRYYIADSTILDSIKTTLSALERPDFDYYNLLRKVTMHTNNRTLMYNDISKLPSVRIVLTSDTTKWTRCPVVEMCDDYTQAEGNARRFQLRRHASVDVHGNVARTKGASNDPSSPNYISDHGMGWFPGYAISLETGERLNIIFGEDSRYVQFNGADMMWNPVSTTTDGTSNYVMGGRHFIYVLNSMNMKFPNVTGGTGNALYRTPSYDAGKWAFQMLSSMDRAMNIVKDVTNGNTPVPCLNHGLVTPGSYLCPERDSIALLYSTVAWVNMPTVNSRFEFSNPLDIPCEVAINLNVNRPYGKYYSSNGSKPEDFDISVKNKNNPMFMFELTDDIVTLTGQATADNARQSYKDSILSRINVVPNPYYSHSAYETQNQLETKVRFINVPANSTISIYTVDGTLVRRLGPTTASATTLDWDLHNHQGIPIAGGMYLIHVHSEGIGDRVIKWFGTMRPVDLNSIQF